MISFWRIFYLEIISWWRSGSLVLVLLAIIGWMAAVPHWFVGDGTGDGARELMIRYSWGGVTAILAVVLMASATGLIATERRTHRLQLSLIRPVRRTVLALAKMSALVALGALFLAVAAGFELLRSDPARPCREVLRPLMPSPREEAEAMYDLYMNDPDTPSEAKTARKDVILRILEARADERYQTIAPGECATWRFNCSADPETLAVRLRFTNLYESRDDVIGSVAWRGSTGSFSDITKSVAEIPLHRSSADDGGDELSFTNNGVSALMLRPRKDIALLAPADGFGFNLVRSCVRILSALSLLVAFGTFLGAGLGRPVALFVTMVFLLLGELSPSVVESSPEELDGKRSDAIGLAFARFAAYATHPVSTVVTLDSLAADECVPLRETLRAAGADLLIWPLVFAGLCALVMPRKLEP